MITVNIHMPDLDEPASIDAPVNEPVSVQGDPWFSGRMGFDVPEEDRPATVYVYTNDSVREPSPHDLSEWNGPAERGLVFLEEHPDGEPFWAEWWGRVMFFVEEGDTR